MNDISIIEKEGQRNNNNLNLKNVKDKFTNTVDKRSFIFEKIEKDVRNLKNHFKQIKSNSMDERLNKHTPFYPSIVISGIIDLIMFL